MRENTPRNENLSFTNLTCQRKGQVNLYSKEYLFASGCLLPALLIYFARERVQDAQKRKAKNVTYIKYEEKGRNPLIF